MGGLGVRGKAPSRRRNGGLGAEHPALEIRENHMLSTKCYGFLIKNNAFKTWHRNWLRNMIQLVVLMGYVGGG